MEEMDNADKKNMDNLVKVGKNLLLQKALRMNVNTFVPVELDQTNAEALDRCVGSLRKVLILTCPKIVAGNFQ